jgi:hypothetical protein
MLFKNHYLWSNIMPTTIQHRSVGSHLKRVAFDVPKTAVDSSEALKLSCKVTASAIGIAGAVGPLSVPVQNLGSTCGSVATAINAVSFFGHIYNLVNSSGEAPEKKAKSALLAVSSGIDLCRFGSKLGIIPGAKIAAAVGKVPVLGSVVGALGLNVIQSAFVLAATGCSIANNVKVIKQADKVIVDIKKGEKLQDGTFKGDRIKKWSEKVERIAQVKLNPHQLVSSAIPNPEGSTENTETILEQAFEREQITVLEDYKRKYEGKINWINQHIDSLQGEYKALSDLAVTNKIQRKYLKELPQQIDNLALKSARYQIYVDDLSDNTNPIGERLAYIEKNYQHKVDLNQTILSNANSTKRRSFFSLVADICKVALVAFVTLISILFPAVGFGLSLTIGILSLVSSATGWIKVIQDKLFHKIQNLPTRPDYVQTIARAAERSGGLRVPENGEAAAA